MKVKFCYSFYTNMLINMFFNIGICIDVIKGERERVCICEVEEPFS